MKSKPEILTAVALSAWLLPVAAKLPHGLTTALLSGSLGAAVANVVTMPKTLKQRAVEATERELEDEILAHQLLLQAEAKKRSLSEVWGDRNPIPDPIRLGAMPVQIQQPPQYQPALEGGYIGQNTIAPGPVAPVATPTAPATIPATPAAGNVEPSAIDRLLSSPWVSRCVFGAQRSGKTMLVSSFTKSLGAKTYHINLGSFGGEDKEYWSHAQSITANLTALSESQAAAIIGDCIELVQRFAGDSQAVLVVDEWSITASTFHRHKALLEPLAGLIAAIGSDLVANGVKRSQALYLLAPEMVASKLSEPGKIIKSLALVLAGVSPAKTVTWQGNKVSFSQELYSQIKANFPACPALPSPGDRVLSGDRICSVDGVWFHIPDFGAVPPPTAPNTAPATPPTAPVAPAVAPVAVAPVATPPTAPNTAPNTAPAAPNTAALERALATGPSDLHWKAVELSLAKGGWMPLRDIQRSLSLPSSEVTRGLINELLALELGEAMHDEKYNRLLFRAYEPDFSED